MPVASAETPPIRPWPGLIVRLSFVRSTALCSVPGGTVKILLPPPSSLSVTDHRPRPRRPKRKRLFWPSARRHRRPPAHRHASASARACVYIVVVPIGIARDERGGRPTDGGERCRGQWRIGRITRAINHVHANAVTNSRQHPAATAAATFARPGRARVAFRFSMFTTFMPWLTSTTVQTRVVAAVIDNTWRVIPPREFGRMHHPPPCPPRIAKLTEFSPRVAFGKPAGPAAHVSTI